MKSDIVVFWFRRDLRMNDNHALYRALRCGLPVLPIFIFDTNILIHLQNKSDARVSFIYNTLYNIHTQLEAIGSGLRVYYGNPTEIWKSIIETYNVRAVFFNNDYEPYARKRDEEIEQFLQSNNINVHSYKDQVIFEKNEITKDNGLPYTVFTPYSKKWLSNLSELSSTEYPSQSHITNAVRIKQNFPTLEVIGFRQTPIIIPPPLINEEQIIHYTKNRDNPALDDTTKLGIHLRFGTISTRTLLSIVKPLNSTFVNELIWREFFMQILWHFPSVIEQSFKKEYDAIEWRNNDEEFEAWTKGKTGYPMVDAGMRQLNETGFMHNRVRMVTASFLCKHLLIDWRRGEEYFAEHLLDYDQSANNGNWQWAAGTGCDAAPYFRVFNPTAQQEKFDPDFVYCKRWVPELGTSAYIKPIVEHAFARQRALEVYKSGLNR